MIADQKLTDNVVRPRQCDQLIVDGVAVFVLFSRQILFTCYRATRTAGNGLSVFAILSKMTVLFKRRKYAL